MALDAHRSTIDRLCDLLGVETGYHTVDGHYHRASDETKVAILAALGAPLDSVGGAEQALEHELRSVWQRPLPEVMVAWVGQPHRLTLRAPGGAMGEVRAVIALEQGGEVRWSGRLEHGTVAARSSEAAVSGLAGPMVALDFDLGLQLPIGYHSLALEAPWAGASGCTAHLLVAPERAFCGPGELRTFGLFAPVYALPHRALGAGAAGQGSPASSVARHGDASGTASDTGGALAHVGGAGEIGDLGDLGRLAAKTRALGGGLVGTLPMLACFYGEPRHSPSPYSPVSRLFWNELYLDLSSEAWRRLGVPRPASLILPSVTPDSAGGTGEPDLIDYRAAAAHRRAQLEPLVACAMADASVRARVESFAAARPRAGDYAQFRAFTEASGKLWGAWPERERAGDLRQAAIPQAARDYHLFAQFALAEQLSWFKGQRDRAGLYLDLPVGVDGDGYDVWRDRDAFAGDISVGAPPDPLAWGGQNWAVPPLHPRRQREDGYRYFRACIAAHMEHATMLRIDHVMGLHRLFWIASGGDARDGVYVRYPSEELYAVIAIESHRHRCAVAGEDLGTVPDEVRPAMAARGLHRLFVAQFEWHWHDGRPELHDPPPGAVTSLDTHDTLTFAAFAEQGGIAGTTEGTFGAMARFSSQLAASAADVVLLTVEDLWLEHDAQNVPGTHGEASPNWRRRMKRDYEEVLADPKVASLIAHIASLRPPPA